uniref:Translation initiation factor beta propellor-like domain-containing protein n=2 Tax=Panagrolaimus sp. ES5 TaxID=591445 RepID=A0AC34FGU3_9BILA
MAHYVASANEFPVDVKVKHGITKVQFANDNYNRILGVATWDGFVKILDVTNPNAPLDKRNQYHTKPVLAFTFMGGSDFIVSGDTDGNYQTRSIKCFPDGHAFVMSSIEGRVAVEYFDLNPEIQKNKYAFKCHRQKVDDSEFIYPVNAIAFHPQFNSFATGGSDGLVNVWDPSNRKRLCQLRKFNTSVVSLDFSSDGQFVALATTYMYESDVPPVPVPDPEIMVRKITDFEVKPK